MQGLPTPTPISVHSHVYAPRYTTGGAPSDIPPFALRDELGGGGAPSQLSRPPRRLTPASHRDSGPRSPSRARGSRPPSLNRTDPGETRASSRTQRARPGGPSRKQPCHTPSGRAARGARARLRRKAPKSARSRSPRVAGPPAAARAVRTAPSAAAAPSPPRSSAATASLRARSSAAAMAPAKQRPHFRPPSTAANPRRSPA